jgi:hypothetical protein
MGDVSEISFVASPCKNMASPHPDISGNKKFICPTRVIKEKSGSIVVKALCYKPQGCGFENDLVN